MHKFVAKFFNIPVLLAAVLSITFCSVASGVAYADAPVAPLQVSAKTLTTPSNQANQSNQGAQKSKYSTVTPSKPLDKSQTSATTPTKKITLQTQFSANSQRELSPSGTLSPVDTTPPSLPTNLTASASGIQSINASWGDSQDAESGIQYYVFGIGTNASGDYSTLANIRWWQVTYSKSFTINLNLDPSVTYYVSVYAINGANLNGPIVTSSAVHPIWQNLGAAGNVMSLAFAPAGLDASGNAAAGWTPEQTTTFTNFFNRMYPILVQIYGPPADNYTVSLVRDLRYTNSNVFFPSTDDIHMSDGFSPQLFTHELLHAFRNDHILSSDQSWNYNPTLSGFEESFAQAVSYEAMNIYVTTYTSDPVVPSDGLWGSSNDWDYDFQNSPELRGTDFWSDGGATGLYWNRYEEGAAALRKINIESPDFYKRFNQEYYNRINANPMTVRVSRALIVDITKTLVPQIEGTPAASWIDQQNIFYTQNVYGNKIFHRVQDYPSNEFYAFQDIYFLNTMSCGSEWTCWDGTKWVYYNHNGATGSASLKDYDGSVVWSGGLRIEPLANPSDGNYMVGYDTKTLTTGASNLPWPGGNIDDFVLNLTAFGLYKFESTFTDPSDGSQTTNSIYRVLGSSIAHSFAGVWGGIPGHKNGSIQISHEGYPDEPATSVVNGAFAVNRAWTGVSNPRTGGHDSVPGKIFITFTDSDSGNVYHAQRNIDYGSSSGSQLLLLDFPIGNSDTIAPTASVSSPSAGISVYGQTSLAAIANDNVAVTSLQFVLDGQNFGNPLTTAPYIMNLDSTTLSNGNHTLAAIAFDAAGNSTTSSSVTFVVDNSTPAVSVTSPANGAVVTGNVPLSASVVGGAGISKIEYYRDGTTLIGTATTSPYGFSWNTSGMTQGSTHTIYAKGFGVNGRSASSTAVSVRIKDTTLPATSVSSPANNSNVSGTVTIDATASDNIGVTKVEFYIDTVLLASDSSSPYSASWDTNNSTLGSHSITAKAYDLDGNTKVSNVTTVTAKDATLPAVSITAPANNSKVTRNSTVSILATASDNRAISKVEFYVNNVLTCTTMTSPYSCNWAIPAKQNVKYTLTAKAYDSSNNTASATSNVTSQ